MKRIILSFLILLVAISSHAEFTKQGAESLLNSLASDKSKAKVKMLEKLSKGYDSEISEMTYYCDIYNTNIIIQGLAEQFPELSFSHEKIVESAYKDEVERKKINTKYGLEYKNGCGEKVPLNLNSDLKK